MRQAELRYRQAELRYRNARESVRNGRVSEIIPDVPHNPGTLVSGNTKDGNQNQLYRARGNTVAGLIHDIIRLNGGLTIG